MEILAALHEQQKNQLGTKFLEDHRKSLIQELRTLFKKKIIRLKKSENGNWRSGKTGEVLI